MADSDPPQISPPVTRIVAILNFLAGHPEQAFTLTEISKSLRLSSATCHALLGALSETGYVHRTVGKTYVLGPALSRVARASLEPALVMQVTRPEMRLLADEFDVVCSAYHLKDGQVAIFERASALSHIDWHSPQLHSIPVAAPVGGLFMAWDEAAWDAWLASANPPVEAAEQARLRASQRFLQAHGFTFGERTVPISGPEQARRLQNQYALTDHGLGEIEADRHYDLAYVAAPIFARPGIVSFGLSLAGFTAPIAGAMIDQMGRKLRAACDRVGAFIVGKNYPPPG
jgi:DNA-binding IclR family transcriptional regulator